MDFFNLILDFKFLYVLESVARFYNLRKKYRLKKNSFFVIIFFYFYIHIY